MLHRNISRQPRLTRMFEAPSMIKEHYEMKPWHQDSMGEIFHHQ